MPRLDERLKIVARQIRGISHADIGSDHGHLLVALIKAGRIQRGVAIENKQLPLENSIRTLQGLSVDVRFADGLEGLNEGEVESLSICGIGGKRMVEILQRFPERVPQRVILQPNRREDLVRLWARDHGFHLCEEFQTDCKSHFVILCFDRRTGETDPAYDGLDLENSLLFGPHLLRQRAGSLWQQLRVERDYLNSFRRLQGLSRRRLEAIEKVLAAW